MMLSSEYPVSTKIKKRRARCCQCCGGSVYSLCLITPEKSPVYPVPRRSPRHARFCRRCGGYVYSLCLITPKKVLYILFQEDSPRHARFCRRCGVFCLFFLSYNSGKRSCISCSKKIKPRCARFCRRCGGTDSFCPLSPPFCPILLKRRTARGFVIPCGSFFRLKPV